MFERSLIDGQIFARRDSRKALLTIDSDQRRSLFVELLRRWLHC